MSTLIFFDINGTLIARDERTDIPYANAVNALLGIADAMKGVDTSARSDKDVLMEVLSRHGMDLTDHRWQEFLALYQAELDRSSTTDVWRPNADAVPFVRKLYEKGFAMALITGELSMGAEYKLKKLGIWDLFMAGGFGEDGLKRFDIADAAMERVLRKHRRRFQTQYLIGDTVLDIETARHLGACSIAVTTGSHSREMLLQANPDYCIDRFSELADLFSV